jgi:HAD superfamily hydrolase (TIGR01509 family)
MGRQRRLADGSPARLGGVRVLLFDFDGTLWDPEPEIFRAYEEMFREHRQQLDASLWSRLVGTIGFNLWTHLEELTGAPVDRVPAEARVCRRRDELLAGVGPRPGVLGYLQEADTLGIPRGIVSNSPREWISRYAGQSGLAEGWCVVETADGNVSRAKPDPHLYRSALTKVQCRPDEAIAFEDSPAGILAAKRAGIRCVAVPNPMTTSLDLSEADLVIGSFEEVGLSDVLHAMSR